MELRRIHFKIKKIGVDDDQRIVRDYQISR